MIERFQKNNWWKDSFKNLMEIILKIGLFIAWISSWRKHFPCLKMRQIEFLSSFKKVCLDLCSVEVITNLHQKSQDLAVKLVNLKTATKRYLLFKIIFISPACFLRCKKTKPWTKWEKEKFKKLYIHRLKFWNIWINNWFIWIENI